MSGVGGLLILGREAVAWFGALALPSKLTVVTIALATTGVGFAVVAPDALPISPFRSSHSASSFPAAGSAKSAGQVNPSIVASAKPTGGAATVSAAAPTSVPVSSAPTMPGADDSGEGASSTKATKSVTTAKKATATSANATSASATVYYKDCEAAWAAGAAPIPKGKPGYRIGLDPDQNGVACEKKL